MSSFEVVTIRFATTDGENLARGECLDSSLNPARGQSATG